MENNDDEEHLLSVLGVTAANPDDIERDVIAEAEEKIKKKKRKGSESQTQGEEAQAKCEIHEQDGEQSQETVLKKRLVSLEQEINAVEAGLESLKESAKDVTPDQDPDEAKESEEPSTSTGKDKNENVDLVDGSEENASQREGLKLQLALGEERLASLQEKRNKLLQKLFILESGMVEGDAHGDDADGRREEQNPKKKCVKFVEQNQNILADDEDFNNSLESASGFVETERDRLIRTGVVTPFASLVGFERRVERSSLDDQKISQAESSASMSTPGRSRSRTKLLDTSEVPKLPAPTREFRRLRKVQRHSGADDKPKKRKRPLPEKKWRKRAQSESESLYEDQNAVTTSSGGEDDEIEELEEEPDAEEDVCLEGGLRIPSKIYDKLFDYQKTGVKWLWELHCQKAGGIIADEMGLGKTIQVTAFLAALHYSGLYKPSIVICPVTLLRQWKREVQKWYGNLEVEILHDSVASHLKSPSKRKKAKDSDSSEDDDREDKMEDAKRTPEKHGSKWNSLIKRIVNSKSGLLLTTYEQLRILREKLLDCEWGYAVLDEGHRIRNPDAEITLVCKQLQTVHRIIMTGAPIQNKLTELWSLFDFVFPGKLGVLPVFQAQFALPISIGGYVNATPLQVSTAYKCAVMLRDLVLPYLLRRLKCDVNAHLTKKTEHVLFCSLTEEQRSAYRAFLDSSEVEQIIDGNRNSLYGIDILRKICNHADLIEREHSANHPDYGNPERSGKLKVLAQVLDVWQNQGHRVLIFTQTQQMLDIIENHVINKGFTYRRMDGSTPIRQRMALIDEFNESSHVYVFILTTKVGGLGTNLIGANKVIIFDPDWNPSTDMQARERAWRIGQTRDVTVYRLITRGTIEEKVYHRQIYKHFLTNKILKDPKQRRIFKARDMRDLFTLNEENPDSKTETSTLFGELENVELLNANIETLKPRNSLHIKQKEEQEKADVSGEGKASEDTEAQEDESRILKCLFDANGIHSAINHDAIESMNDYEKMKVDSESAKLAQQAAEALMQSRIQRSTDSVSVPTWTGRSGAAGAPTAIRRKFGSNTNNLVRSPTANGSHREPAQLGFAGSSIGRALSSKDVLARIRGQAASSIGNARLYTNGHNNNNGASTSSSAEGNITVDDNRRIQTGVESNSLIMQLRTYIEQNGGSVSSTQIVSKFKDKVPPGNVAFFRQLLKEVAVLKKQGGEGRWVLKDENE